MIAMTLETNLCLPRPLPPRRAEESTCVVFVLHRAIFILKQCAAVLLLLVLKHYGAWPYFDHGQDHSKQDRYQHQAQCPRPVSTWEIVVTTLGTACTPSHLHVSCCVVHTRDQVISLTLRSCLRLTLGGSMH
jgi:hypothetical protein